MNKRKNKYIPNLAEFYFSPKFNWSITEAQQMYDEKKNQLNDRIIWGDCIEGMKLIPEKAIDLVIADPPFGIDFSGKEKMYNRKNENVIDGYCEVKSNDYNEFTMKWISELPRIMKPTASAYIFSGYSHLDDVLYAVKKSGLKLVNHIIWKYNFGVFAKNKFTSSHYHVLFLVKDEKKYFFHRIQHYNPDVWEINRIYDRDVEKNGTKLPKEVIEKCVDFSSKPGDTILDPFLGNGTTAEVAISNYRHYYGFELNNLLKSTIESNIKKISVGERYIPYKDRLPSIEELGIKYPHAYKIYCEREKLKIR